jgi:hypothetical protein
MNLHTLSSPNIRRHWRQAVNRVQDYQYPVGIDARYKCHSADRLRRRLSSVLLTVILLSVIVSQAVSDDASALRGAVVRVGGCSGVCVDPAGFVLTAKHCQLRDVERVQFEHAEVLAVRIYESDLTEGPVVYDCVGRGYPSVVVAQNAPVGGERVSTMGYPHIDSGRTFRQEHGTVLRGGQFRFLGKQFPGNVTDMPLREGWSGGPLFNSQGEVIGLANSTDASESIFISFAATRKAYEEAVRKHLSRRPLRVVISLDSRACLQFLSDFSNDAGFRSELQEHFQLVVSDAAERADLLQQSGATDLPVFILPNATLVAGYQGQSDLLQHLSPSKLSSGTPVAEEEAGALH